MCILSRTSLKCLISLELSVSPFQKQRDAKMQAIGQESEHTPSLLAKQSDSRSALEKQTEIKSIFRFLINWWRFQF